MLSKNGTSKPVSHISTTIAILKLDFSFLNFPITGDIYFEIDQLIIEELDKFLLEKALKIVYKKQDYLKLDRLLKLTFP